MAVVIMEESEKVRGYFSIKNNNLNKTLDYYIETKSSNDSININVVYVVGNKGFTVKTIQDDNIKDKKIYKGSIKDIISIIGCENNKDEGICVLGKNNEIFFAEYLNKKKINVKNLKIENVNKAYNEYEDLACDCDDSSDDKNNIDEALDESKNSINIKHIDTLKYKKVTKRNTATVYYSTKQKSNVSALVNSLLDKATKFKKTKIYSKEDLVIRITYNLFKDALLIENEYFLLIDSIVNLFKSNIKKYGHFLISIVFKKNGQIKYIQIGIPDENASLNVQNLNSIKYKNITESNKGYWFYKYQL